MVERSEERQRLAKELVSEVDALLRGRQLVEIHRERSKRRAKVGWLARWLWLGGMYRLVTGFYAHLRQKEEFSVLILGLDNAGKTTFLEQVKSTFNDTPALDPASIAPTIGQNSEQRDPVQPSSHCVKWDGSRSPPPFSSSGTSADSVRSAPSGQSTTPSVTPCAS